MRILLADTVEARSAALVERLRESGAHEVIRLRAGETLLQAVAASAPDIIIVDMARPDRDALDGVRQVTERDPRPIAMFVDEADSSFMAEAIEAGVSSYTVRGAELPDVRPVVEAAIMIFRRFQNLSTDLRTTRRRLEEREAIDQAKALLMRRDGIAEPQAYRWLRKRAMNTGRRIADVAIELLENKKPGGGGK